MGSITEQNINNQLKKGQGETNQRLDAILDQLRQLNASLRALGESAALTK